MKETLDAKEVAKTNPAVDVEKIEEALLFRRILEQAGVFKKADYRLSPPLGGSPVKTSKKGSRLVRMTGAT